MKWQVLAAISAVAAGATAVLAKAVSRQRSSIDAKAWGSLWPVGARDRRVVGGVRVDYWRLDSCVERLGVGQPLPRDGSARLVIGSCASKDPVPLAWRWCETRVNEGIWA